MNSIKGGYFILDLRGERVINDSTIWENVNRNYTMNNKAVLVHGMLGNGGTIFNDFFAEIIQDGSDSSYRPVYKIDNIKLSYNGTGITSEYINISHDVTKTQTKSASFPLPTYEEGSTWTAEDAPMTATLKLNGNTAYILVNTPTKNKMTMTNVNMTKSSGTIDWSRYPNQQSDNTFSFKIGGYPTETDVVEQTIKMYADVIIRVNPKTKKISCTVDASSSAKYGSWFGSGVLD